MTMGWFVMMRWLCVMMMIEHVVVFMARMATHGATRCRSVFAPSLAFATVKLF